MWDGVNQVLTIDFPGSAQSLKMVNVAPRIVSGRRQNQEQEAVMRSIALGASAIATLLSCGVEAADFAYPPSGVGPSLPASVPPPQVLVVPGAPAPIPQYYNDRAPAPPPVAGLPPYSEAPPITPPGVVPGTALPPRDLLNATPARTGRPVRRCTRRLRRPPSVRLHHKAPAGTPHKSTPVQRALCAG